MPTSHKHWLTADFPLDSKKYSLAELEARIKVVDEQQSLFRSLLYLLSDCGYLKLTQQENGETRTAVVQQLKEFDCNPSQAVSDFLKIPESSQYTAELLLIDRCGSNLLSVLTGRQTGLDTLFPDGSTDLLQNLYQSFSDLSDLQRITATLRWRFCLIRGRSRVRAEFLKSEPAQALN